MEEDDFIKFVKEVFPEAYEKINGKNMADLDLPGVLVEVSTSQEPHDIVYEQDLSIIVVFKGTAKTSVRANLNDTVADLKRKMENDLGISTSKQVLSFKSTMLQDDQSIHSIHGIENGSHIELAICDDDTAQSSSNKRVKLMLKDRSFETVADNLDDIRSDISTRIMLLSNGKELQSNADYEALSPSGKAKLELMFPTLPTASITTDAADPTFTNASASATRRASSSRVATKQPSKLGGQGTEKNPANVSIIVELNERNLVFIQVNKSHKVSVLRDKLVDVQKNDPKLAGLIPEHYLFTKGGCMIMEDISFRCNSVKHNDTIQIVSQLGEVGLQKNDGKLIKIFVSKRTSMITDKMVMEIVASKKAGALKEELAKPKRMKELGFTIPRYHSFWLFHEQATTGHLFQLVDTTSLSLQRVQEGDTVFVVPRDPLKLKVKSSWTKKEDPVEEKIYANDAVGKLRKILQSREVKRFPLPSQAYEFEHKRECIMDEGKPFYWHHIVGDGELMIHIVPSLL